MRDEQKLVFGQCQRMIPRTPSREFRQFGQHPQKTPQIPTVTIRPKLRPQFGPSHFFMEVATRKVHFAGMTQYPKEAWMLQVAKEVTHPETGFLKGKKILLLDNDSTFSVSFCDILKKAGVQPKRTPVRSPNCNAHIERFFRSSGILKYYHRHAA